MKRFAVVTTTLFFLTNTAGVLAQTPKLMIFGGMGHRTYLGCLNCSQYASDSIYNEYGHYGSPYSADSVFNQYGEYGSPSSDESACDPYANDPPVIVDQDGRFYGRLTLNAYHPQASNNESVLGWLAMVCRH